MSCSGRFQLKRLYNESELEALTLARDEARLVEQAYAYTERGLPLPFVLLEYLLNRPNPKTLTQRRFLAWLRDAFMAIELELHRNVGSLKRGESHESIVAEKFGMNERSVLRARKVHRLLIETMEETGPIKEMPSFEMVQEKLIELGSRYDDLIEASVEETAELLDIPKEFPND